MGISEYPGALCTVPSALPRQVHQALAPALRLQTEPDQTEGHQYRQDAYQGEGWTLYSFV